MAFDDKVTEHEERTVRAQTMGGPQKLAKRQAEGVWNARERVAALVDPGTWEESGLFATAQDPAMRDQTPGDGKVTGFGKVQGRWVAVDAYDFTVKGSSSGSVGEKKVGHLKEVATSRGFPMVFLGESTGARMPDIMGAEGMATLGGPTRFLRKREIPWVSAILGPAFGSAAWHACAADFNVMRRGAIMAVSSPGLISMATRAQVDPEQLGGWRLHAEITGFTDAVVDTDAEAIALIQRFLSYLPSHHNEAPPMAPVPPGSDAGGSTLWDIIPQERTRVYDVHKVIDAIVDRDSVFELKARYGSSVVTTLARINGQAVGIVANNPRVKGGAMDAPACTKVTSFLVLCDSFNIPLVLLVDQPGFLIGVEAERAGMVGKVINWMNAVSLFTMPKIMIIMRKSYGQAYINMGGGGIADESAAWWTADVSFMDPVTAATIVSGVTEQEDPVRFRQVLETMQRSTSAYDLAAVYGVQTVLDPRETRDYLIRMLQVHTLRRSHGVGQHLMQTWPTSY